METTRIPVITPTQERGKKAYTPSVHASVCKRALSARDLLQQVIDITT